MTSLEATLQSIVDEAKRNVRLSDLPRNRDIEKARKRLGDFDAVVHDFSEKRPLRRVCEQHVWRIKERLGAGAHGVVAQACNVESDSCAYAVKSFWQQFDAVTGKPHVYEILVSTMAGDLSIGPFVHDAWTCAMTAEEATGTKGEFLSPIAQPYTWTQLGRLELGSRLVPEKSSAEDKDTKWYVETVRVEDADKTDALELRDTFRQEHPTISLTLMVMEQIQGQTLLHWATRGPSTRDIEDVVNALIKAIDKLHRAGIAHGDLHAGNVMVVGSTAARPMLEVRIVDYGRARIVAKGDAAFQRDWDKMSTSMERHLATGSGRAVYAKWMTMAKQRLTPRAKTETRWVASSGEPTVLRSQSALDAIQAAVVLDDRVVFVMRRPWSDSIRNEARRIVYDVLR